MNFPGIFFVTLIFSLSLFAQDKAVWMADNGDGTYKNPVIFADYSDPDIVRAGDDFFMTASSFNCVPGLPILHSKDLVNWKLVNHAIKYFDDPAFDIPQHGNGVWAPCIRYHDGMFYIYWGDPDRGIYMVKTGDPYGAWSKPHHVKKAYGNIDSSPLWDDDGKMYMVHAFAHSRAGVKSLLQVNELNVTGTGILDKGTIVFDRHKNYPTIEGPKFYKHNGYYFIFAPAGGVAGGWQTILRSRDIYGPYEDKIVLEQGSTDINGPHQGGWVALDSGEDWFMHFQDRGPYGRIVHLNPVRWQDDWPLMGVDYDGNGIGEPVSSFKKPDVGKTYPLQVPQTGDEFESQDMALQWQWQANFKGEWYSLAESKGTLRLIPVYFSAENSNKWLMPNMLLQKFPAEEFTVTAKLKSALQGSEKTALIVMGLNYAYLQVENSDNGLKISKAVCIDAENGAEEQPDSSVTLNGKDVYLRVKVSEGAVCQFSFSRDGVSFKDLGPLFKAREGKWIGAKVGLLSYSDNENLNSGYAEYDWFRIHQ